jgi:hypothetical protein
VEQLRDPERLGDRRHAPVLFVGCQMLHAVPDVVTDRHVRKERRLLEDVADGPPLNGDVDGRGGIEQHP